MAAVVGLDRSRAGLLPRMRAAIYQICFWGNLEILTYRQLHLKRQGPGHTVPVSLHFLPSWHL